MNQEKLLITVNKSTSLIVESASNGSLGPVPEGCMRMSGVFGVTNVKNNNQRYYTNENYSAMVKGLQSRLDEGVFGQLEHPNNMDLNWDLVSHKIESISIDESTGTVSGTVLLLPTEKGKIVQTLVNNGLKLKISSRAKGLVAEDGKVTLSHLETYDLVYRPGFNQARLNVVNESVNADGQVILETIEIDMNEKPVAENGSNVNATVDIQAITNSVIESVLAKLKAEPLTLSEASSQAIDSKVNEAIVKMQNHVKESMHKFATATQNWAINEFAPSIQGWVETVYETEQRRFLVENFAQAIQNWTINEFAPQVQSWAVNEFAPQVQGWAINEFAPDIQKWLSTEFVPKTVAVQETESKTEGPKSTETDDDKSKENEDDKKPSVDESANGTASGAKTLLESIDEQLAAATAQAATEQATIVSEDAIQNDKLVFEQQLVDAIPSSVKHLWAASDDKFKADTLAQAGLRQFTNENQITRFWMTRFTSNTAQTIVEAKLKSNPSLIQVSEAKIEPTPKIANGLVSFCRSLNS